MCTKKELLEQVDSAIETSKEIEERLAKLAKDSEELVIQSRAILMMINSSYKF